MSFKDGIGIELQSLSASAYQSTTHQVYLDSPMGSGGVVSYGRCGTKTGSGNLKISFDQYIEPFVANNFWNIASHTLNTTSTVACAFAAASLSSLLPYTRATVTVEAAGVGETKFESIIAKLIAERK
jgi:hypothetical protein